MIDFVFIFTLTSYMHQEKIPKFWKVVNDPEVYSFHIFILSYKTNFFSFTEGCTDLNLIKRIPRITWESWTKYDVIF